MTRPRSTSVPWKNARELKKDIALKQADPGKPNTLSKRYVLHALRKNSGLPESLALVLIFKRSPAGGWGDGRSVRHKAG